MTFQTQTWSVDGNGYNGQLARMMLASGGVLLGGVIGPLDCIVRATGPTSPGVTVDAGSVIVAGSEADAQGSYFGYNDGLDSTLLGLINPTGGSPRSDMIVVRAEDPTFSGSPWSGSPSGQILFPRILSGVAGGSTAPPSGISAIPLARIDMPASTSNVSQSYITDLRSVWRPLTQRTVVNLPGTTWTSPSSSPVSGAGPVQWPNPGTFSIAVPSWATVAQVVFSLASVVFVPGGTAVEDADGTLQLVLLLTGTLASPDAGGPTIKYHNWQATQPSGGRSTLTGGGSFAIPASLRGTTVTAAFAAISSALATGSLTADLGSSLTLDITFQQLASAS